MTTASVAAARCTGALPPVNCAVFALVPEVSVEATDVAAQRVSTTSTNHQKVAQGTEAAGNQPAFSIDHKFFYFRCLRTLKMEAAGGAF